MRSNQVPGPVLPPATDPDAGGFTLVDAWQVLVRRWRWVAGATACAALGAFLLVRSGVPEYEGTVTLRFVDRQPAFSEILPVPTRDQVATEIEELRSRTLAESAARALLLQVRLESPRRVSRTALLADLEVAATADSASYRLVRDGSGRFAIERRADGAPIATAAVGERVELAGIAFILRPAADAFAELELSVQTLAEATDAVRSDLTVFRAGRDADIVHLRYRDPDPDLAWRVPNAIAAEFAERRRSLQQSSADSAIAFLRGQLDSIARQLAASEDALRRFRERERVINPQVEASAQVQRVIQLEAERGGLEAERVAFGRLVSEVEAAARNRSPGEPSPYRRLAAFPTLMQHEASTDVLSSLATLETERRELLTRRTEADPEVQALATRIGELEDQLRTTAVTYLQGLGDQVEAIDGNLTRYQRGLAQLPRREVEYARLERTPEVLEGIHAMLQTRLKEAEISRAATDRAVRVVDPAAPALEPAASRRELMAIGIVLLGLLLGLGIAFIREISDASLHTRADVHLVTGLPVLGLIPHIRGVRSRIATLGKRTPLSASAQSRLAAPPPSNEPVYTFFGAARPPAPSPVPTGIENGSGLATRSAQAAVLEAYGMLLTNIAFARPDVPARTLVLTSAMPGDGKTTTAVNLAIALATRGQRVLLMDTDLRKGRVHVALEADREPGLSEFLQGTKSWEGTRRVAVVDERSQLHYVTCGRPPRSPSGMLDSPALRAILTRLRSEYDSIILDSPPANLVTDAALLASMSDGVLLVARAGVTDAEALGHSLDTLRRVGAEVLGVVLNDIDFRRDAHYDRAYRFYDTSSYLDSAEQPAS